MVANASTAFLAGVIEGFYGPPWTQAERAEVLDWLAAWGLNTYFYAPKDDLKHRALWREFYSPVECEGLRQLVQACDARGLQFIYALAPGLDLRYGHDADLDLLTRRLEQMHGLGCRHFALLFDDIPGRLDPAELEHWGSLAGAQSHVTNALFRWCQDRVPGSRFLFCPTPYCGRMAAAGLGGPDYLATLGRDLQAGIDVLWTGPEIISQEISVEHVRELRALLRRKPIIWDNLHANDYDGRRFFCGPYAGRSRELKREVNGLLSNPNCEQPLNYVPLRTLGAFVRGEGDWDARAAYLEALDAWAERFATVGAAIRRADLVLLGDCYYLPYEEGTEAQSLCRDLQALLERDPATWGEAAAAWRQRAAALRESCARVAELRDRPLFYALCRRAWELREEMDLLERYVAFKSVPANRDAPARSDFHRPETYRGGMVARLQRLLVQRPDGAFVPAARAGG